MYFPYKIPMLSGLGLRFDVKLCIDHLVKKLNRDVHRSRAVLSRRFFVVRTH